MSIIKKYLGVIKFSLIIFFITIYIAISTTPVALSQEQSIITEVNINKESEKNKLVEQYNKQVKQQIVAKSDIVPKSQLNNLSDKNNEIKAIIKFENINSKNETFWNKLIDNSAFWSFVTLLFSAVFVPIITYFINDKMNTRKTLLEAKKYKYEKKLNAYLDAMKNTKQLIVENNFDILKVIASYNEVYIIGSDNTKEFIDEAINLTKKYASDREQATLDELSLKFGAIENSLREDLKNIEKTLFN